MKQYQAPAAQLYLLGDDILMASDENETAIDKIFDIFGR